MERKRHRKLVLRWVRVADAVRDRRRAHLSDRHHALDAAVVHELLEVFVHMRAVRVEAAAVSLFVIDEFSLRDEVDDIEAEALDALRFPEAQDVLELLAHRRVLPVEVGLRDIEEVQVPLAEMWHVLPGRAAEFRLPVRRRRIGRAVAEDVVIHVLRIALQCLLEPLVRRRGVVEHHIEHQADAACLSLRNQRLEVRHRVRSAGRPRGSRRHRSHCRAAATGRTA